MFQNPRLSNCPAVINLLIINILMLLLTKVCQTMGIDLTEQFGLFFYQSQYFKPWQYITYMFMHSGITHIFFNMWALWLFGSVLEQVWGTKRFLIYYFFTGIGAALLHTAVNTYIINDIHSGISAFLNSPSPEAYINFITEHIKKPNPAVFDFYNQWQENASNPISISYATQQLNEYYNSMTNIPTVGASGAVYGILLAFGMLFPNTRLMLLFPPIPIRAKWFVIIYGLIELFLGLSQPGSQIAHFAHLGGMIFGYFLIKYWNSKRGPSFY